MCKHISGINQLLVLSAISEGHQNSKDINKHIYDKGQTALKTQRITECVRSLETSGFILNDESEGLLVTPAGETELLQKLASIVHAAQAATIPILENLSPLKKLNRWPFYSEWLESHILDDNKPLSGNINTPTHSYSVYSLQVGDQRALLIQGELHGFAEWLAGKILNKSTSTETILLFEVKEDNQRRTEKWMVRTAHDAAKKIGELPYIQRKVAEAALIKVLT